MTCSVIGLALNLQRWKLKKNIVIHVGYPKSGTTTLQKHFFPNVENYKFIGRFKSEEFMDRYKLISSDSFNRLVFEDYIRFDSKKIRDSILNNDNNSFIISEENFIAISFREKLIKGEMVMPDFALSAKKLRDIFDADKFNVKIFFTIRRQEDLIPSLYAQSYAGYYAKSSKYDSFSKYFSFFESNNRNELNKLLDYNFVVNEYMKIFGRENVKVYLSEEFFVNPKVFYTRLIDDFGFEIDFNQLDLKAKENVRFEDGYRKTDNITLAKWLSYFKARYFPQLKINTPRLFRKYLDRVVVKDNDSVSKTVVLDSKQKEKIREKYLESNTKISTSLKLPLNEYGYFN